MSYDPFQTSEKFNENMRRCKKALSLRDALHDERLTLETSAWLIFLRW